MSCNLIYGENKKLESVVADNGNTSLLYKEALKEFGKEQALEIYLSSKSDDFQDNIILSQSELDVNNEPKLKIVLNYLSLQNESKEPLTIQQKLDLRNISLGVENFSVQKLIEAFYSDGIFNISPKKLKKSGLYSDYEIANLANDVNLQEKVKQSLEALKNTEEVDLDTEFVEGLEKTDEVNSFGKLVSLNPNLVQKEVLNKLAATTEQEFENNLADLEYPNFQKNLNKEQLFQEMQGYKKAEVFMEVDGEIVQAKNTDTAVILPLVAKQINNVEILLDINQIQQYDLEILQANQEDTVRILKGIEDNLIEQGIDVAGLSAREINADLMSFLGNLEIFINEPSIENTKAFADVYDTYFEKDLSPKTEIVKQAETDRDFVKLNTNLSEEQVYEQQGLIKVKDGLYIRTNKQDLNTLYANIETYTDKYPKDTTLKEYVQTQIATLEDFKNFDNAEAVYLYKIYFNIENNKNGIEQVSQTEEQGSNRGGEIATDASNFLRGKSSTNEKNSSGRQKSELESFAKQRGYWFDSYKKIGEYIGKGMESEVFLSKDGITVFKVNDLEFYNTPLDYLNTIDEHNNLFPEAPYKLIGFTRRTDTNNFSFILEQPFIEAVRGATQEEVNQQLDKLGFNKSISELIFTKDNVEVLDLHEGNVVVDEKGLVYFIDPVIFVTEQQKEDIQPVKKVTPTKSSANFTGNFEYLTTEFVSDFYIEMLKEREKSSEIYKNFYTNFDINENGIYLKNDDDITMSQIKEYADENLKQYSIISKQMPLLIEQDIQSETKQVRRDAVLNNPQNLEKYQGQFHKLNDNTIILKNTNEEFIKVEGNIFEAVDSDGNLTLYSRLNNVVGEYYNFNNEAPKSSVKIEDYSYLNTQPDSFMSEKKYLSKSAKEKINQENFDCI